MEHKLINLCNSLATPINDDTSYIIGLGLTWAILEGLFIALCSVMATSHLQMKKMKKKRSKSVRRYMDGLKLFFV